MKEILVELDGQLNRLMQSDTGEREIGVVPEMDIGMLFLSKEHTIEFLGGNMDLYVENGKEVQKIRGKKLHVGNGSLNKATDIPVYVIEYSRENTYFIATDGFYEQPGGEKGIPYGYSRFKKTFATLHGKSADEILEAVKRTWLEYRGANKQRDDVTAFCFKVR